MAKLTVIGGKKLKGEVKLAGNKNSVLKLIAASLLTESEVKLSNVPKIRDVTVMGEIAKELGTKVTGLGGSELILDSSNLKDSNLPAELSGRIRASVVFAAPLLARFGKVKITPPGGDQIGERLLTTHFSMMEAFGVETKKENGFYTSEWKTRKEEVNVFLEEASVTATEMAMILAATTEGRTTISGAASEPHVEDLANLLAKMGVKIEGAGTNFIEIQGTKGLGGANHRVIPDHIEGGTFAVASAITGGEVVIKDVVPEHYRMILAYLGEMGVKYELGKDTLKIQESNLVAKKRKFQTRPWPGFPTDLMSPFIVLATQTQGTVLCHDWMYEWRMFFVDDLINMGANIFIADPHRVIVSGKTKLTGEKLYSKDIRAGMSVILAALAAEGESEIDNIEMVERGYEDIEERFKALGAEMKKGN